jgi:hypothetical protein
MRGISPSASNTLYIQVSMFVGQTYTDTKKVEQTVSPEQATMMVDLLMTKNMN